MKLIKSFIVFLFGALIAALSVLYMAEKQEKIDVSGMIGRELLSKSKTISLLKTEGAYSSSLKEKLDYDIAALVAVLVKIKPDFTAMESAPREGICETIKYVEADGLDIEKLGRVGNEIKTYLSGVKSSVVSSIERSQSILGGSGCSVGGRA